MYWQSATIRSSFSAARDGSAIRPVDTAWCRSRASPFSTTSTTWGAIKSMNVLVPGRLQPNLATVVDRKVA